MVRLKLSYDDVDVDDDDEGRCYGANTLVPVTLVLKTCTFDLQLDAKISLVVGTPGVNRVPWEPG